MTNGPPAPRSGSTNRSVDLDSTVKSEKPEDVQTLYKTLEQQYSLIGEMDSENVRLQAENAELKERLLAGSTATVGTPADHVPPGR